MLLSRSVPCSIFTSASTAYTLLQRDTSVLRRVFVTSKTMSFGRGSLTRSLRSKATQSILAIRDGFQMVGPHTSWSPTQMIELKTLGNGAN